MATLNPPTYTDESGTYKAVLDDPDSCQPGCEECDLCNTEQCTAAPCIAKERPDGQHVHFVRINDAAPPA